MRWAWANDDVGGRWLALPIRSSWSIAYRLSGSARLGYIVLNRGAGVRCARRRGSGGGSVVWRFVSRVIERGCRGCGCPLTRGSRLLCAGNSEGLVLWSGVGVFLFRGLVVFRPRQLVVDSLSETLHFDDYVDGHMYSAMFLGASAARRRTLAGIYRRSQLK